MCCTRCCCWVASYVSANGILNPCAPWEICYLPPPKPPLLGRGECSVACTVSAVSVTSRPRPFPECSAAASGPDLSDVRARGANICQCICLLWDHCELLHEHTQTVWLQMVTVYCTSNNFEWTLTKFASYAKMLLLLFDKFENMSDLTSIWQCWLDSGTAVFLKIQTSV